MNMVLIRTLLYTPALNTIDVPRNIARRRQLLRDGPPARLSPPPAPLLSVMVEQGRTRCARCHHDTPTPPSRADRSAPLPASPPAFRHSSGRSCCPGRGRAARRCGPAPSLSASPPSHFRRGSGARWYARVVQAVAAHRSCARVCGGLPARPDHAEKHALTLLHRESCEVTPRSHHHLGSPRPATRCQSSSPPPRPQTASHRHAPDRTPAAAEAPAPLHPATHHPLIFVWRGVHFRTW